jgi:hypothetical protein
VTVLIKKEPTPAVTSAQDGMPPPTCTTCIAGSKTFPEQASTGGAATFRDPRAFLGRGVRVSPLQQVEVVCQFYDFNAPSVRPGWWYLLAGPWRRGYYSSANSYLNGDPPEGPHLTPTDNGVPRC